MGAQVLELQAFLLHGRDGVVVNKLIIYHFSLELVQVNVLVLCRVVLLKGLDHLLLDLVLLDTLVHDLVHVLLTLNSVVEEQINLLVEEG